MEKAAAGYDTRKVINQKMCRKMLYLLRMCSKCNLNSADIRYVRIVEFSIFTIELKLETWGL